MFKAILSLRVGFYLVGSAFVALVITGCAYKGTLHSGFYHSHPVNQPLPLKVQVIYGPQFEHMRYSAEVHGNYSIDLDTFPAVEEAMTRACQSVFQQVIVAQTMSESTAMSSDFVLFPTIELQEAVLILKVSVKDTDSGALIQQYQASGNLRIPVSGEVHAIEIFNAFPCCGLLSPITIPVVAHKLGHSAERELEARLTMSFDQIAAEMRNDPALVKKAESAHASNSR